MGKRRNRRQMCFVAGRSAIQRRVPPPTEEDWDLDPAVAAKVLAKRKNWSAPGPDHLANFWWKRAESLHVSVATAFQAISSIDEEYPPVVFRGENVADSQTWGVQQ